MASKSDDMLPFWGNATSWVWKHLGFSKDDNGKIDKTKAICRICGKQYAFKCELISLDDNKKM